MWYSSHMETQEMVVNDEQREAIEEAELLAELKGILEQKNKRVGVINAHIKILNFVASLEKEGIHKNTLDNCKIYHVLIGSTIGIRTELDLPDGRLEKFIRDEL